MTEADRKEIEQQLKSMNRSELVELARVTLIERRMKKVRNQRYYAKRKLREQSKGGN